MEEKLIAPCGMNCGICMALLRKERKCPGCWGGDAGKSAACLRCIVVNCEMLKLNKSGFCYECGEYPCARIKQLDKRYRAKYSMSMTENLAYIEENGMKRFLKKETEKWKCPDCGQTVSCHRPACPKCGEVWTPTKYH
jgi:hypothetical protein